MKMIVVAMMVGLTACQRSEVSFAFYSDTARGLPTSLVHVQFADGFSQRMVDGEDFRISFESAVPRTQHFETRGHGTLSARVWLLNGTDTMAAGDVELPLREDWRWGVDIFVADSNPMRFCFGCFGATAFKAAPGAPGDSLFLVWGGNSISNPVVY